jgi:hypothetical protein
MTCSGTVGSIRSHNEKSLQTEWVDAKEQVGRTRVRQPANRAVGTGAQSAVKAQFEFIGWGVAPNLEHDVGTDQWVMAHDESGTDLGRLLGVQVKSGATPFNAPVHEGVQLRGWWFRERDARHFDYWTNHSVPHILVLHRVEDGGSFWVHVTQDKVVSTGKGRKIFVPVEQRLDAAHRRALLDVALSRAELPEFQGSVWDTGQSIPESAVLRYALITPRLLIPHGNRSHSAIEAHQALALLTRMRLRHLHRWREIEPRLDPQESSQSPDWAWRFYAAMSSALLDADAAHLSKVAGDSPTPQAKAAAVTSLAAFRYESEDVVGALTIIEEALGDSHSPVDLAWIEAHRARLLVELGDTKTAQEVALRVAPIGRIANHDPTASVLAGSAADLIFRLSDWDGESLASAIKGHDNLGTWWRSQTILAGLAAQAEDSFKNWSYDRTVTMGADDVAWLSLRSAMAQANHAADTPSWRNAATMLSRRILMTSDSEHQIDGALDLARLAGADKVVKATIARLLDTGPVGPVAAVANRIDLDALTRTPLAASVRFVAGAADVLSADAADRHARWAMRLLCDPGDFQQRLRPSFLLRDELPRLLLGLSTSVSPSVSSEIREHIVGLSAVTDQLLADRYARLVRHLDESEWTEEQLRELASRRSQHHEELAGAIDYVIAHRDADERLQLIDKIAEGDLDALHSFGSVIDLPTEVVLALMAAMEGQVEAILDDAKNGTVRVSDRDPLRTLVLLSIWHPTLARWKTCAKALEDPTVIGEFTIGAIELIGQATDEIPREVALLLREALKLQSTRAPLEHESRLFCPTRDPRGPAKLTYAKLFPEETSESDLVPRI